MTPPVIMDDEYFSNESESTPSGDKGEGQDYSVSDAEDEEDQYIEVIEGDSEEEEMNELVLAAERLLADTSEFDTEEIVPHKNNLQSDETDEALGGTLTSLASLNDNEELHTRTFNMSSLPRKLDMKVPEEVNFEWLCSCVPLMSMKNEMKSSVSEVAKIFQHKLEQGDPGEEYKVKIHVFVFIRSFYMCVKLSVKLTSFSNDYIKLDWLIDCCCLIQCKLYFSYIVM